MGRPQLTSDSSIETFKRFIRGGSVLLASCFLKVVSKSFAMSGPMVYVTTKTYDVATNRWGERPTILSMDARPFGEGSMRRAYSAKDWGILKSSCQPKVVKLQIHRRYTKAEAEADVKMQMKCVALAEEYNSHSCIPKKVSFCSAQLVQFHAGPYKGQYGLMEDYIPGTFEKHNLNFPMRPLSTRNTPQAFSHFTFERTDGRVVVCDVQGVGDQYTDPQIHCMDAGLQYGQGDFGAHGIISFVSNHRCNSICRALKLTPIQELPHRWGSPPGKAATAPVPRYY
ncbi:EEF2K [Branchiostoma lanceolatum]|uniref:EEF2K protein n=1 Tax=Branchiostoma lanceolatum TaxID=7740 RepID=A0A8J9Z350_BRALA|nr:EEF2K [Branchiostoma lanceolatum]